MPTAVALRALGLGDLLAGVPALRALRRGLPDHEVVLAMPAGLAPLAELAGVCDRVVPTVGLEGVPWTGPPPDVAVDLHGNGPASKAPLLALRPGRLVAFAGPGPDGEPVAGPEWRADEHERHRWCRLLEEGLGLPAYPTDLRVEPPPGAPCHRGPGAVLLHPGAAYAGRRWPAERFAAVAAWASEFAPVLITGSEDERPLAEEVRRLAGLPDLAVLAGRTDPLRLAGLVAGARLVVCGDTGVAHLASAFGTPSVVLFGPIPPAWWGPPEDGPHLALWHGRPGERGDPHGAEPDERLLRITPEEVVAAAVSLLGRPQLLPGTPPGTRASASSAAARPAAASAAPSRGAAGRG
ncbi:glycosyltransferase family 9 protein [Nocardioides sp. TF02-7]|uniref:glycosyltransferase family 9 protein n=1 Tax=Nocardioides sp. TF02-7 TaxID=2917724 RepID=UPI001F06D896|nr:glycosyltransferase family 9 protein [Nocardioides sp. TF02-7]UMG93648.1 glycosyltransferase family 9 protein [Nocardioides sp. TF02-7]